jgi:formamidopyrimidine-DNA glycosylase
MPELPEICNLAQQMKAELPGKRISEVEVRQAKCLNVSIDEFMVLVSGKTVGAITSRGKWIFMNLDPNTTFLLSLGMGGDTLLHKPGESLPQKYQLAFTFDDGSRLSIAFWWFGYAHALLRSDLAHHKMTANLGLNPLDNDFTFDAFDTLLNIKKGGIKSVLMDQKNIAGIGNVYIQDILFTARLHPNRKTMTITSQERHTLYDAIHDNLKHATDLGGLKYEKDLYGQPGRFGDFLVGYKENQPCPICGTTIQKIKTGSTATFICPQCQV